MAHINSSLAAMNDALSALQARIDALLGSLAGGLSASEFEARVTSATQDAIDAVLTQVDGLDVSAIQAQQTVIRKVMGQINAYGLDKYLIEYFDSSFSVADQFSRSGVVTVAGDDSMDISSTTGITVGGEYVVETPGQSVVIQVKDILSSTRFRATSQIPYSLADATLRRTNWTMASSQATAKAGQVYYSKQVSLGDAANSKGLVIRRVTSAALLRLYYRAVGQTNWTEALWAWRRDHAYVLPDYGLNTAGPAEGEYDYEYVLPVAGQFEVKIICELPEGVDAATTAVVRHIVGLNAVSGLGGEANPDNPVGDVPSSADLSAASMRRLALIYG